MAAIESRMTTVEAAVEAMKMTKDTDDLLEAMQKAKMTVGELQGVMEILMVLGPLGGPSKSSSEIFESDDGDPTRGKQP